VYVAVATLTTSSILDPELTITDPWLKVFTRVMCSSASGSWSKSLADSGWASLLPEQS
jgi:hypothetical protein